MSDALHAADQQRVATRHIGDYAVLELLGSGGFGSVYKVKRRTAGQSYLAMKEVRAVLSMGILFRYTDRQTDRQTDR